MHRYLLSISGASGAICYSACDIDAIFSILEGARQYGKTMGMVVICGKVFFLCVVSAQIYRRFYFVGESFGLEVF